MPRRLALWALTRTDELVVYAGELLGRADRRWYRLYMDLLYRLEPRSPDLPP